MPEAERYLWPAPDDATAPAVVPGPRRQDALVPGPRHHDTPAASQSLWRRLRPAAPSGPAGLTGRADPHETALPGRATVPGYAEVPERYRAPGAGMHERLTERVSRIVRLAIGRPAVRPGLSYQDGEPVRPAVSRRPAARAATGVSSFRSHVTARGALLGMFLLCLVTCLVGGWRQVDILDGLAYCAGCVLMPVYARRDAQLRVVISAPAVFLLALVLAQALTAQGSSGHGSALSVAEGTFLTLADVAPWLFAGTALCLVIALTRGLSQCVRDLRADPARSAAARRPEPGGARHRERLEPDAPARRRS